MHLVSQFRYSFIFFLSISFIIRKYENIFSARRMDYIELSDADEVDQNTGEHLYPEQIMPFKKNKLDDDEDDEENIETFKETMNITENDLDATLYDNYTWCFRMTRKGVDDKTKESFEVRRVYRNRRFITCLVKNFYSAARAIPYPLLVRGNGAGSSAGCVFLYSMHKGMKQNFDDRDLQRCCIDLNELLNYGTKGIQYGNVSRDKEVVPFELGKGGRIKIFSQDKTVDVLCYTDEVDFWDIKSRLLLRYRGDYVTELTEITPTPVNPMTGDWYVKQEVDDSDDESEMEMSRSGVVKDMEQVLYEQERARVLGQVNLELARMQLENERHRRRGLKTFYVLDNTTRLKLFFHLMQGEETNAFAPTTIQRFGTQDFTPTLAYEEHRDMAEGEDSGEDWNDTTLDDTLETISGYEFEYEGVETDNENDTDDSADEDSDENEGESEVNEDGDGDESDGESDEKEGQSQVNDENHEDDHVERELTDIEDELLGDSLNDSMEITQETEEELLGLSDAGLFAASTQSN